jgi:predicted nuclease of predicted toxin-antitoxin system
MRGAMGVIVTADSDFLNLAEERGAPPKVVRLENCNTGPR